MKKIFSITAFICGVLLASSASADICATIIADADLNAYQGRTGGYDANNLCHSRTIPSEQECRRLTGGLYYGFSNDSGKGFTHCAFRIPSGSAGRSSPSGGQSAPPPRSNPSHEVERRNRDQRIARCSGHLKNYDASNPGAVRKSHQYQELLDYIEKYISADCDTSTQIDWINRETNRLWALKNSANKKEICDAAVEGYVAYRKENQNVTPKLKLENQLDLLDSQVGKFCTEFKNVVDWIPGEAASVRAQLARLGGTPSAPAPKKEPEVTELDDFQKMMQGLGDKMDRERVARLDETKWCASNAPGNSPQNSCIMGPLKTGDNYAFSLNLACSAEYYSAAIAAYNDLGHCTRQIIVLTPKNNNMGNVYGNPKFRAPRVIDAAVTLTPEAKACYKKRHASSDCE